jgi:hypothetical protein
MARRRGSGGIELNFDGLADSVTNLVGALILLVLLIIGVTREAVSQTTETPPRSQGGNENADGEVPLTPLANRAESLRSQLRSAERDIAEIDGNLEQLTQEVDELLQRVESVQPPASEPEPAPDAPDDPTRVYYRPPKLQDTKKDPDLVIICENGRVSIADLVSINAAVERTEITGSTVIVPEDGDFDLDLDVIDLGIQLFFIQKLVRKQGHLGEPLDAAIRPGSEFQTALARNDANTDYLQFAVYPDSHETFRAIREIVWEKKFDLNWAPISTGEQIGLGGGPGMVQ